MSMQTLTDQFVHTLTCADCGESINVSSARENGGELLHGFIREHAAMHSRAFTEQYRATKWSMSVAPF